MGLHAVWPFKPGAAGGKVSRILLGIMLIAALFSMWVENTATAAVLIPVALTVASQVPDPKKAKGLLILLVMGIAYSASLGGMVTVMGSGSNAVAAGFLQESPLYFRGLDGLRCAGFLVVISGDLVVATQTDQS